MIKSTTKKKVKKASSKKANPKCRTIKVRRKISMGKGKRPRILQVRRKVCNPDYGHYYKTMTYGKLPTRKEFDKAFDNFEEQVSDITFKVRNDKLFGNHDFSRNELWDTLKLSVKKGSEEMLSFANDVLEILGFEWV